MNKKSWVVWNSMQDKSLEMVCLFEGAVDDSVKFLYIKRDEVRLTIDEQMNLDSLGSGLPKYELNCVGENNESTLVGVFDNKESALAAKDLVQSSLLEFLVHGTKSTEKALMTQEPKTQVQELEGKTNDPFSRKEPSLSESKASDQPNVSTSVEKDRGNTVTEKSTGSKKSAILALVVVLSVGAFSYFSTVGGVSNWIDRVLANESSIILEGGAEIENVQDLNQGAFIELVKSEAVEHFKAQGEDAVAIRKKVSTLFSQDPSSWPGIEDTIAFGNVDSSDVFYIFADPACPACKALEAEIVSYKENTLNYRVIPISARGASVDQIDQIMCSEDPKLAWEKSLRDDEIDPVDLTDCKQVGSALRNRQVFDALGFNSTPSIWMPNTNRIIKDGVPTAAELWNQSQAAPL